MEGVIKAQEKGFGGFGCEAKRIERWIKKWQETLKRMRSLKITKKEYDFNGGRRGAVVPNKTKPNGLSTELGIRRSK